MIPAYQAKYSAFNAPRANISQAHFQSMLQYLHKELVGVRSTRECFHAIFLDRDVRYIEDSKMGAGDRRSISLRMRDLFGKALLLDASAVILAHNHPSGTCRPSERDVRETKRLIEVGQALDVELLDHLIFTEHGAYSMRAGGIL